MVKVKQELGVKGKGKKVTFTEGFNYCERAGSLCVPINILLSLNHV